MLNVTTKLLTTSQLGLVICVLKAGGVIVYPTDTTYGIGCDATNTSAVKKVFQIKRRPKDKQVSVMVSGIAIAKRSARWNARAQALAAKWWPGALTIILKKKKGRGTIGLRAPKHALALQMASAYGKPIISTSANISGQPACYSIPTYLRQLKKLPHTLRPDLLLNVGALPRRLPSTVVDASSTHFKFIRYGAIVRP